MVKKQHIKVIKIPLIREENPTRVSNFPKTHTLYLELLENKNKIKQDFINKTYIPSNMNLSKNTSEQTHIKQYKDDEVRKQKDQKEDQEEKDKKDKKEDETDIQEHHSDDENKEDDENIKELDKKVYEDKYEEVKEEPIKEIDDENQDEEKRKRREEKRKRREERHKRREERHKEREHEREDERDHEREHEKNHERYDKRRNERDDERLDERDHKRRNEKDDDSKRDERDNEREDDMQDRKSEKHKNRSRNTNDSDNLSERLKLLLADNESIKSVSSQSIQKHKSRHEERSIRSFKHSSHDRREVPPTLDELEAGGLYQRNTELRDINNLHQTDYEEEDGKRELIFKFDLLKKSYKDATNIPEFSIHSDYNTMKKTYESTVRRLSLDSTVESYKTYLIGGFMLVEFVLGNFLKFDMQGFTQQQIVSINTYERLLIELGEKSYVPEGSKWPVELRLVFMIIMNAAFFIISKMIMKKTGANLMNMINSMNVSSRPAAIAKKRPMKGPSIDPNDIPDLNSV